MFNAECEISIILRLLWPPNMSSLNLWDQSCHLATQRYIQRCRWPLSSRPNRNTGCATPISFHGDRHVQVVQPVFRSLGEMKIHGLSRQIFEQKAHFEASNFHSFLVPSRQISLAFVNGFRQSKSFIFSLIFKECIFGMQIDFYSGVEIQLFLNRFSPSISLSSILAS